MRRTQEERRRTTRAAVLAAALEVLIDDGYANFSASAVATRAGVSRGALERYFPTRNDLLVAVIRHAMDSAVAHAERLAARGGRHTIERFLLDSEHFFFSPVYRSMMELAIAAASDRALAKKHGPIVARARETLNRIWLDSLVAAGFRRQSAGLMVQIDDPFLADIFVEPALDDAGKRRRAEIYVEATNLALKGIPAERVRFHTCYGINEGPRLHEASLPEMIGYMLRINAGSYSFEAANPRHEHEYHLFETVKIPEGKVLCPGVITHASNIVEHPELICERILRYAERVGRENVIAAADCGFSSQALYRTEVHPTVVWEKFKAMRQGADLATRRLWKS